MNQFRQMFLVLFWYFVDILYIPYHTLDFIDSKSVLVYWAVSFLLNFIFYTNFNTWVVYAMPVLFCISLSCWWGLSLVLHKCRSLSSYGMEFLFMCAGFLLFTLLFFPQPWVLISIVVVRALQNFHFVLWYDLSFRESTYSFHDSTILVQSALHECRYFFFDFKAFYFGIT